MAQAEKHPEQKTLFERSYLPPLEVKQEIATAAMKIIVDGLEKAGLKNTDEVTAFATDIVAILKASLP